MKRKYIILTVGLIVFLFLFYFLYNPSKRDTNLKEKNDNITDNKTTRDKEDDVNLIDYLNLEAENRKLREEIDLLEAELFEYEKSLIESDSNGLSHYYEELEALSVYKEVTDNEIIILIRNETDDGYRLTISSEDSSYFNDIADLENNEIINYTGTGGFYSGLINSNEINTITVNVNEKSYEAKIINFADNISFWYAIYDHKRKSTSENPDQLRIEAMNKSGELLWEGRFDGDLGG